MSVYKNLLPSSYKGVSFLVPTETKSSGKKTVKHDYAGSNRRYVEELGEAVPEYSITAIITGTNAIQNRIRLETQLKSAGRGLLIHPSLGQLMVTCTEYSSSSSDDKIGEFIFDISFSETEQNISLTPSISSVQSVSSLVTQSKASLDSGFVGLFINNSIPDNIQSTASQLTNIFNQIKNFSGDVNEIDTIASSVLSLNINDAINSVAVTSRNGVSIVNELRSIYDYAENVSNDIESYLPSWIDLSIFGLDRKKEKLTTQKRITKENNLSAVEEHTQLNALLGMYESAAYTDYETDIDLLDTQNTLEEKFELLVDNSRDGGLARNSDFRELISNVRVKTRDVLEKKSQVTWRVVDIEPNESSMLLTSYRFYGNIDNIDILSNLNPEVNVSINDEIIKGIS